MRRLTLPRTADRTNNKPSEPPRAERVNNKSKREWMEMPGSRSASRSFGQAWRESLKLIHTLAAAAVAALATAPVHAADISGAGASFPYPVYTKWADAYKKETGVGLNYQSIGSGGGIKQIQAKTVTFGATDAPLKGDDLTKHGRGRFPAVMGGIVPVINVEGVKPGDLILDGPTLAKIFLAEIKSWDDPAIAKLNPNVKLPKQAIAIVHRSDGSGTTYNFTYYLGEVSPTWKSKVGVNTSVRFPAGIGAKGNEGVRSEERGVGR